MFKYTRIIVLALCLSLMASQAIAQWNLAVDFSTDNNPNPPWDVGTISPAKTFGSYDNNPYDFFGNGEVAGWGGWQIGAVTKNITGVDFMGWTGQWWNRQDEMFMMPTSSDTHQMGVAWTSPVSDTVSITGRFYGATVSGDFAAVGPVRIVTGGSDIWTDTIDGAVEGGGYPENGPKPEAPFDLLVDVTVGDQIMFGFGNSTRWGDYRYALDVDITTAVNDPNAEQIWQNKDSGDWNVLSNWIGGVPNDDREVAVFGGAIQTSRTVFTDSHVTVQGIHFNNSNTYAITGTGSITLQTGTSAPRSDVTVFAGDHEFQAPIRLNNETDVTVAGESNLSFINVLNLGGQTLNKIGEGEMTIRSDLVTAGGTINVMGGIVSGNGTVGGNMDNVAGTISPGNSPGVISVVPEPSTVVMLAWSLFMLTICGRNRLLMQER